jgi:hypothetical protein
LASNRLLANKSGFDELFIMALVIGILVITPFVLLLNVDEVESDAENVFGNFFRIICPPNI